jgi:hypothetical protein
VNAGTLCLTLEADGFSPTMAAGKRNDTHPATFIFSAGIPLCLTNKHVSDVMNGAPPFQIVTPAFASGDALANRSATPWTSPTIIDAL